MAAAAVLRRMLGSILYRLNAFTMLTVPTLAEGRQVEVVCSHTHSKYAWAICIHAYRQTLRTTFMNAEAATIPVIIWLAVAFPRRVARRSWSSRAALLLKVMTTSCHGLQPC